jgi:hypothetical protein
MIINFISELPNYSELVKLLSSEILNEIYQLSKKKKTENQAIAKQTINASNINISKKFDVIENIANEEFIDSNGFLFGVFNKTIIQNIDKDLSMDIRIANFENLKEVFDVNKTNNELLKFSNSFFSFISKYINDEITSISLMALSIIKSMLTSIQGINIIANIFASCENIIQLCGHENIQIKEVSMEIIKKILMVMPTSSLFPLIYKYFKDEDWMKVVGSLNVCMYIFQHLNEIYNDIDFSDKNFDETLFLEIIRLFHHEVPKV